MNTLSAAATTTPPTTTAAAAAAAPAVCMCVRACNDGWDELPLSGESLCERECGCFECVGKGPCTCVCVYVCVSTATPRVCVHRKLADLPGTGPC
jgi:hypothetical protein